MLEHIQGFLPIYATSIILAFSIFSGVWKIWRTYYPFMLYFITVQIGVSYLTYGQRLWVFKSSIIPTNHVITDFFLAFTNFAPMVLLYLSKYPFESKWHIQIRYILLWVTGFSLLEYAFFMSGLTTFHYGWNMGWSIIVWATSFIAVRLHHTHPHWAWLICFSGTAFMILYFDNQVGP